MRLADRSVQVAGRGAPGKADAEQSETGRARESRNSLVRSCVKDCRGIVERADAPAHRKWYEQFTRRPADYIEKRGAMLIGRGNIQQHNFIGAGAAMGQSQRRGIAGVAQVRKLDTLHHASGVHIQAGDNALGQHSRFKSWSSQKLRRS